MHLSPPPDGSFGCCPFLGGVSVVVGILFNVLPIVCGGSVLVFVLVCIKLCPFVFCNHLEKEERESWFICFIVSRMLVTVNVLWLFLTVPWVGLQL